MPTLSASDYTTYLKFKAAAVTPIRPAIQTRDNATLSQSVINANVFASQAAEVITPTLAVLNPAMARVIAPTPERTNNPKALSTVSWTSGTAGAVSSTTSSKFQQSGGLPAKNVVGTYTRLPQNAGWIQGNMVSSGPKRF
jgi:hypothetical protein